MVSTLASGLLEQSGFERWPAGDIVLCSWVKRFTLTVPLSTQVYKGVLPNLMLGGNPVMDQHSMKYFQSLYSTEIKDKGRPDGPLGLFADFPSLPCVHLNERSPKIASVSFVTHRVPLLRNSPTYFLLPFLRIYKGSLGMRLCSRHLNPETHFHQSSATLATIHCGKCLAQQGHFQLPCNIPQE